VRRRSGGADSAEKRMQEVSDARGVTLPKGSGERADVLAVWVAWFTTPARN